MRTQTPDFATIRLPARPTEIAPDGSAVRVLLGLTGGTMAHFELPAGATSRAVTHRSVEEVWFVLSGRGELWRKQSAREEVVVLERDVCVTLPRGTHFQLRASQTEAVTVVAVTIPRWPGNDEAEFVPGLWTPSAIESAANLGRILRYAWAAPCTVLGLCLAAPAFLLGASARIVGGVVEVAISKRRRPPGVLLRALPFNAITFGHTVIAATESELDRVRLHEREHVRQYERWGALFFIAYPLASLWQLLRGQRPYVDNWFEVQARAKEFHADGTCP